MQTNKKYWLQGGLIGILVIGVISLVLSLTGIVYLENNPFWIFTGNVTAPLFQCNGFCVGKSLIYTIPVFIIETFVLGALVGWIYGKIKQK